jgi:hypothetical protein
MHIHLYRQKNPNPVKVISAYLDLFLSAYYSLALKYVSLGYSQQRYHLPVYVYTSEIYLPSLPLNTCPVLLSIRALTRLYQLFLKRQNPWIPISYTGASPIIPPILSSPNQLQSNINHPRTTLPAVNERLIQWDKTITTQYIWSWQILI